MKKLILTLALVAMGSVAYAQVTDNDIITASANIQSAVNVTAGANLEFGTVTQNTTSTIAFDAANAGTFSVTGQPGLTVDLALTLPATLTGTDPDALPITYTAGYDVAASADINPSNNTAFTTSAQTTQNVTLNASGNAFVSVGGSITPDGTHSGSYSGTITLTATYN